MSDDLQQWLNHVSLAMQLSDSRRPSRGPTTIEVSIVKRSHMREIGRLLECISEGGDARKIFRQDERRKPNKQHEHFHRAMAYWSERAVDHSNIDHAVEKAKDIWPGGENLSRTYIIKIAQHWRDSCFTNLDSNGSRLPGSWSVGRKKIRLRTTEQVEALRTHLRRRGESKKWGGGSADVDE